MEEEEQSLVTMFQMDPLYDGQSKDNVVRTIGISVGGCDPICSDKVYTGPVRRGRGCGCRLNAVAVGENGRDGKVVDHGICVLGRWTHAR